MRDWEEGREGLGVEGRRGRDLTVGRRGEKVRSGGVEGEKEGE